MSGLPKDERRDSVERELTSMAPEAAARERACGNVLRTWVGFYGTRAYEREGGRKLETTRRRTSATAG